MIATARQRAAQNPAYRRTLPLPGVLLRCWATNGGRASVGTGSASWPELRIIRSTARRKIRGFRPR